MEARRRVAVLCSHLLQSSSSSVVSSSSYSLISTSNCVADKSENDKEKKESEENCVFCKIVRGESPSFKIYEDDVCLCILDLNPLAPGHSLVIPKCHFSSLKATPPAVVAVMCSKVPLVSNAIMKATNCDSFNMLVNCGVAAGQVIFHTHLHIIPRRAHDHLWKSENSSRRPLSLDQEAAQLAFSIREKLSTLNENWEDGKAQGTSSS